MPVGHGHTRRAWVVVCCLGHSRAGAGALIFSKEAPDVLWGMARWLGGSGQFEKANARAHRMLRARPIDRLAEEREVMRPLPAREPDSDRRWVMRVTPDPDLRFDTNDYLTAATRNSPLVAH